MNIEITGYDREVDRGNPKGMHVTYDVQSDRPVVALTFWLDDGATPLEIEFPVKKGTDGRYVRGFNLKPTITGSFHFHLLAVDDYGDSVEAVSPTPVTVTAGGDIEEPEDVELTDDHTELVAAIRKQRFPELYQPGHPEEVRDGFLRLDRVGENKHDQRVGLERAAEWLKYLAWALRKGDAGMATAKPGSENHGGATSQYPQGFTTDALCRSDGAHWDFQQDGGGAGLPQWDALPHYITNEHGDQIDLWAPMKARFVPAFDPSTL